MRRHLAKNDKEMEWKHSLYKPIINIFFHHVLVVVRPKKFLNFKRDPSVIFQSQEQVIIIQVLRGRLKSYSDSMRQIVKFVHRRNVWVRVAEQSEGRKDTLQQDVDCIPEWFRLDVVYRKHDVIVCLDDVHLGKVWIMDSTKESSFQT